MEGRVTYGQGRAGRRVSSQVPITWATQVELTVDQTALKTVSGWGQLICIQRLILGGKHVRDMRGNPRWSVH